MLRSRSIDRQLDHEKHLQREIKILLLGAGESGKSTFLKQMRIIHGENYSADDRLEFRPIIYHNILKGMKMLIEIRRKLGISLSDPSNEDYCEIVIGYRSSNLTPEQFTLYGDALAALWKDSGILEAYQQRSKFQVVSAPIQFVIGQRGGPVTPWVIASSGTDIVLLCAVVSHV